MKNKLFLVIALTLISFFSLLSQNPKVIVGDNLEDENAPFITKCIGMDATGIYFLKHGKAGRGITNYVEKYDQNNCKLIFRCILPKVFENNVIHGEGKETFAFLNNGNIDLLISCIEASAVHFFRLRINSVGVSGENPEKLYSINYKNKIKNTLFTINLSCVLSTNKEFLSVYNKGETKEAIEITVLKLNINKDGVLSVIKVMDYSLAEAKPLDSNKLKNVYNDGRIGSYYIVDEKENAAILNPTKNFFNKAISVIVKNDSLEYDQSGLRNGIGNCFLINDNENVHVVYNKRKKSYGFLTLKYDNSNNTILPSGINYLSKENHERLRGIEKPFAPEFSESFVLRQSYSGENFMYKVISRSYSKCTPNLCVDKQSYLFVLVYDKQNKLLTQKIVPFHFGQNFMGNSSDGLNESRNKNFGAILIKDDLYILTNESEQNKSFDTNKGLIKDFEECKSISIGSFCCYKVSGAKDIEKSIVNSEQGQNIFNLINNFSLPGNYQYVYIQIKGKRHLGKVSIL